MGGWKFSDHNSPPMLLTTLLIVMALSKKKVEKLWGNTPSEKIIYIGNLSSNFPIPHRPALAWTAMPTQPLSYYVLLACADQRARQRNMGSIVTKILAFHTWDTRPISDLTTHAMRLAKWKKRKQHASSLSDTLWSIYLSIFLSILSYLILSELILSYVSKSREKVPPTVTTNTLSTLSSISILLFCESRCQFVKLWPVGWQSRIQTNLVK